ncbi:hypothetical protein [uncultured Sphingomonas sp.]|uniref:hypothetical protein n=1 Tax=uncultured Sphingomonas sp. TaxID=158754 RepID=UPI00260B172C|nr:hypothetical protein [uncultured Sphingomonas sp.]
MSGTTINLDWDVRIAEVNAYPVARACMTHNLGEDGIAKVSGHLICYPVKARIVQSLACAAFEDVTSDVDRPFVSPDKQAETSLIFPADNHRLLMPSVNIGVES